MVVQSARDRVFRTLVLSIGIGSLLFTALGVAAIIGQADLLSPAFVIAVVVLFCGIPPLAALVSVRLPVGALRVALLVHAVVGLVAIIAWVPAMTVPDGLVGGDVPWLLNTIAVATSAAALTLPTAAAWIYTAVIALASGVLRYLTYGAADPGQAIQDAIMLSLLAGFLVALIQLTLAAGRRQDEAARAALASAAARSAALAGERVRAREVSISRDAVLAALEDAAENTEQSRAAARRRALVYLHRTTTTDVVAGIAIEQLDAQLRAAAVDAGIPYSFGHSGAEGALDIPSEVVDALVEATEEAMRNSLRHAGDRRGATSVRRGVRVSRLERGVEIVVTDDGRGFRPDRIAVDRLGIRLTILQRVLDLPGTTARIVSAPGRGTTIIVSWSEVAR